MDTKRHTDLRESALQTLEPEEYDRLVVSVPDARRLGRLRFWQEQLLARLSGGTVGVEEFLAAFDGAALQRPPAVTAEEPERATGQPDWKKDAPAWVQEGRQLNESEWLAGPPFIYMLWFLLQEYRDRPGEDRRHRLFGCACCRQSWDLLQHDAARKLVELCESFVDGEIGEADFRAGADPALFADLEPHYHGLGGSGQLSACALHAIGGARGLASENYRKSFGAYSVAQETSCDTRQDFLPTPRRPMSPKGGCVFPDQEQLREKIELIRDIFGNPFRPVAFAPTWRTSTVVALAAQMYAARDFIAMPILADALQDAGCDSEDILSHCRGPSPHVRGCWVVDLVLGKK